MKRLILVLLIFVGGLGVSAAPIADMQGTQHDLAALTEKSPVVLVFWQSWCGPCKKEAPKLVKLSTRYQGALHFFGVVSGPDKAVDARKVHQFITRYGLNYPQIRDRNLSLTKTYRVKGTPTIVILGKGGKVLYHDHRVPKDWSPYL